MSESRHPDIDRAEELLRPAMPDVFRVIYMPDMPRRDGKSCRWFQVVFAVGPGDAACLRQRIHELFPRILRILANVELAREAEVVSLRARRFCPESRNHDPNHPVMFIEADWLGSVLRPQNQQEDFTGWADECLAYHNHFNRDDPLTRQFTAHSDA